MPHERMHRLLVVNFVVITEVYKNNGNDENGKRNFRNAVNFYTEGIKVNCIDEELKAKLYCNRAPAHFRLSEMFYFNIYLFIQHVFSYCKNRFNGNISFAFQAIQKPYARYTNQCFGCFVNFWVIFRYIWEEIVFLERVVKLREIRNIEDLVKF